jgi:AcrR family transcriptional regulator
MSNFMPVEEKMDPRVRRTRALIDQAFKEVLVEKGFQSGSVQDITEKAGINRSTFYLHFADKYTLLDYSISQSFRQELEKRSPDLLHYNPQNLKSLIITVAEFILHANTHCKTSDPQFETLVERQVIKQVQSLVQTWCESVDPRVDFRSAAIAASWAIYGLASDWSHDKNRPDAEAFAERIIPLSHVVLGLPQLD